MSSHRRSTALPCEIEGQGKLDPDDICCPVCLKALSPKKTKFGNRATTGYYRGNMANSERHGRVNGGNGRTKLLNSGAFNPDTELVVAARCGHMFHKFCLRHYCHTYRIAVTSKRGGKVECPACAGGITMTAVQQIDYKAHLGHATKFDKDLRHALIMNSELQDQMMVTVEKLQELERASREAKENLNAQKKRFEEIKNQKMLAQFQRDEKRNLTESVDKYENLIKFMLSESLKMARLFLSAISENSKALLAQNGAIPKQLIPHLAEIKDDDKLLMKFAEILAPLEMDEYKSDTQQLLDEILRSISLKAKNKAIMEAEKQAAIEEDECKNILKQGISHRTPSPMIVKVTRSRSADYSIIEDIEDSKPSVKRAVVPLPSNTNINHALRKASSQCTNINQKTDELTPAIKSKSDIEILYHVNKGICKSADYNPNNNNKTNNKRASSFTVQAPPRNCKSAEPVLTRFTHKKQNAQSLKKSFPQTEEVATRLPIISKPIDEINNKEKQDKQLLDNTTQTLTNSAAVDAKNHIFDCGALMPARMHFNNTPRGDTNQHSPGQMPTTPQSATLGQDAFLKPSVLQCMLDKIEEGRMSRGSGMSPSQYYPSNGQNDEFNTFAPISNQYEDEESRFQQTELKYHPSRIQRQGNPMIGYQNNNRKDTFLFEVESPRKPIQLWNRSLPPLTTGQVDINNNNIVNSLNVLPVPSYMKKWKERLPTARQPIVPFNNNCANEPALQTQTNVTTRRQYTSSSKKWNGYFIPMELPPLPEPYVDKPIEPVDRKASYTILKPPEAFQSSPRPVIPSQQQRETEQTKHIVIPRRNKMYHRKNLPPPPAEVVPTTSEMNAMASTTRSFCPTNSSQLSFTLSSPDSNMIVVNDRNSNSYVNKNGGSQIARPETTSYLNTPIHIVVHHHHPEPQIKIQAEHMNSEYVLLGGDKNSHQITALPPTWNSLETRAIQNPRPSVTKTNEVIHIEKNWDSRQPSMKSECRQYEQTRQIEKSDESVGGIRRRFYKYKKIQQQNMPEGTEPCVEMPMLTPKVEEGIHNKVNENKYNWLPPPSPLVNSCASKWQFSNEKDSKIYGGDCFNFSGQGSDIAGCFNATVSQNSHKVRTTQHVYRKVRKCRKNCL